MGDGGCLPQNYLYWEKDLKQENVLIFSVGEKTPPSYGSKVLEPYKGPSINDVVFEGERGSMAQNGKIQ